MFLAVGYNICNLFFAEHNLFVWLQQRYWMGFALEIRGLPDAYEKIPFSLKKQREFGMFGSSFPLLA